MGHKLTGDQLCFEIIDEGNNAFRWSAGVEVLFGLSGENSIRMGAEQLRLSKGELLAVNPFQIYNVEPNGSARVISLMLPREILKVAGLPWKDGRIICYSRRTSSEQKAALEELKTLYANLFQVFLRQEDNAASQLASQAIRLVSFMAEHFFSHTRPGEDPETGQQVTQRIQRILTFIHDNMRGDLSLSAVAAQEYLTPNYLSRFFKKHLHVTFTEYLTMVRLQHAARELQDSGHSVTRIALESGFPNVNSFIGYFREKYGITPGQYRKQMRDSAVDQSNMLTVADQSELLHPLLGYAPEEEETSPPTLERRIVSVNAASSSRRLLHTWRRLLNIGYAREGLLAQIQDRIRQAQQEIGFEFLRFHGIFDEDMQVYREDEEGAPHLDFTCVDLLFDFVLSAGLRPYLELSFAPPQLAKSKNLLLRRNTYFTIPKDLDRWEYLVSETLLHLIQRYGAVEVRRWKFTAIPINMAFLRSCTFPEYYEFYSRTYRAVKAVDTRLSFGGPGCYASSVWEDGVLEHFLDYAGAQDCIPDFFCMQAYPYQSIDLENEFLRYISSHQSAPSVLSEDEAFLTHLLGKTHALLERYGLAGKEVIFEEWNSTLWQRDISGDTCYKSAYITKNICENYDMAGAFGYWTLSDLMGEQGSFESAFHGGYGLFTCSGIPKSGYYAMELLAKAGDILVGQGDGWLVTRQGQQLQIYLYHYVHYDRLYRYRYRILKDPGDAYKVFVKRGNIHLSMEIGGIEPGPYRIQRWSIGRQGGSSFDKWLEMGSPPYLRRDEVRYLTEVSRPDYRVQDSLLESGYRLEATLTPHETQLIVLTPARTGPVG